MRDGLFRAIRAVAGKSEFTEKLELEVMQIFERYKKSAEPFGTIRAREVFAEV
jgi:hypothetical protein